MGLVGRTITTMRPSQHIDVDKQDSRAAFDGVATPTEATAAFERGVSLRGLERWADALAAYDEAARLGHRDKAAIALERGRCLWEFDMPAEALVEINEAVRLGHPNQADVARERAACLLDLGRPTDALKATVEAERLGHWDKAGLSLWRGECLRALGRPAEALASYVVVHRISDPREGQWKVHRHVRSPDERLPPRALQHRVHDEPGGAVRAVAEPGTEPGLLPVAAGRGGTSRRARRIPPRHAQYSFLACS